MVKLDFTFTINELISLKKSLIANIKTDKQKKDNQKKIAEIQKAISCLKMCVQYGLTEKAKITEIPISDRSFGYYRIVEYDEMDNQLKELVFDDNPFELYGLNLIVEREDKYL